MKNLQSYESFLNEKWDAKVEIPKSEKGKHTDKTIAELKDERKKLLAKKSRSASEVSKLRELNFAIRAKQMDKWGKIDK
jgi:hypothetical protein